jgi:hypothetical protein
MPTFGNVDCSSEIRAMAFLDLGVFGSNSNKSFVSHHTCCIYLMCELNTYSKSP